MTTERPFQCLSLLMLGIVTSMPAASAEEDVAPVVRSVDTEETQPVVEPPLTESDRDHWAFRPVVRNHPPTVNDRRWPRHSIDCFITAKLQQRNVSPAPEADRSTLLRRLSFDLTGLPPTLAEQKSFESDFAPDAFERQVDRLLASTAYGERWAQHWLDLARFAETDGFEHDKIRAGAWKYRDWVIGALNANVPYDQFIRDQIAGDLDGTHSIATMFCLSGPDMPDQNDQDERRHLLLNEITSTVGSVFLGLQFGCAECHDHKYDPISQSEFYRLRAVFESAVPPLKRDVPVAMFAEQSKAVPARLWIRGNHRRPGPIVPAAFPRIASQSDGGDVPAAKSIPRAALADWLVRQDNPLTARVFVNRIWKVHFGRGLFETPSDVGLLNAEPTHPDLLDWLAADFQANGWNIKRLHRQIVGSATWRQSSRPNPADTEWELRLQSDPENKYYSRSRRRRLDGEALRDAMLQMTELLTDERGGPGVMPPLPEELVETLLKGQWTMSPRTNDHNRRSIYIFARRNLRYPLFDIFDRPSADSSCAARNRSTTPTQSLHLLNSAFTLQIARHLAGQALQSPQEPQVVADNLYRRAYGRHATLEESQRLVQFVVAENDRIARDQRSSELALPMGRDDTGNASEAAAWVQVCLALINASEMIYVD